MFAPPCLGPFSEPMAAAIVAYVSVPDDDTRCVVNDELLPPPCSACKKGYCDKKYFPYYLSVTAMIVIELILFQVWGAAYIVVDFALTASNLVMMITFERAMR